MPKYVMRLPSELLQIGKIKLSKITRKIIMGIKPYFGYHTLVSEMTSVLCNNVVNHCTISFLLTTSVAIYENTNLKNGIVKLVYSTRY